MLRSARWHRVTLPGLANGAGKDPLHKVHPSIAGHPLSHPSSAFLHPIATMACNSTSLALKRKVRPSRILLTICSSKSTPHDRWTGRTATARTSAPHSADLTSRSDWAAGARHIVASEPNWGKVIEDVVAHRGGRAR